MKIARLIEELRDPGAYPHPVQEVEVRQTHISAVFLAGVYVYKVKKPVDLDFLDFTTLDRRRRFCREEVRLNRRLAPDVYLGVVPIRAGEEGGLDVGKDVLEDDPESGAVEYAVKMRRLPDDATVEAHLEESEAVGRVLERLGRRIADFHGQAASGPEIARFGRLEVVAGNARENLEQSRPHVGETVSEEVHRRLALRLEERLEKLGSLIEERARRHVPRDTHGDLHLEHVYLLPDRDPPEDLVVIDCIEFNERFRYADPISDMAFLAMDLLFHGRPDLERRFSRAYLQASGDTEGMELLPFYRSYRAAIRGKVDGMVTDEEEVPAEERRRAVRRARGHWLLALSEIEEPARRPALVLVGGLPGTGKSTLAGELAERAGFQVVSSDRVRKELAGLDPSQAADADFEKGLYAPEWTRRTYRACLERVREGLFRGRRLLVDASFREEEKRRWFRETAREWGVRHVLLVCRAPAEVVRDHLEGRGPTASDADWKVYRRAAETWEEPETATRRVVAPVSTAETVEASVREALERLREAGLWG